MLLKTCSSIFTDGEAKHTDLLLHLFSSNSSCPLCLVWSRVLSSTFFPGERSVGEHIDALEKGWDVSGTDIIWSVLSPEVCFISVHLDCKIHLLPLPRVLRFSAFPVTFESPESQLTTACWHSQFSMEDKGKKCLGPLQMSVWSAV